MSKNIFTLLILAFFCPAISAQDNKPNIILVMADDVSWECFGCYGADDYKTPHLDALANKGIRFAHCYSTPICTTSRVKIMTGKYNFRNYTHFGYLSPEEKTFGHLLKDNGYKTAVAGKWQLNGLYNRLDGCEDSSRPHQAGFDEYMLWQLTRGKGQQGGGERFWNPPLEHNGKFLTKEMNQGQYGPDMLCDFVCDFIQRHHDEPFFVYYPMVLVHDPFVPTPDSVGAQKISDSLNKQPKDKQQKKDNFVAMVNYMDKIVGRIVAKVEEVGQAENTIILFTADNGTNRAITSQWNGQEIRGGKAGMKDMGTHVPLIAYWKGHTPEGVVLDDLVDFTDFYATFADAADIDLNQDDPIDGVSFFPQLNGKTGSPRSWVVNHYEPYWNKAPGQFVRNAEYKLYNDGRLFHVPDDLEEKKPLTPDSIAADTFQQLSEIMKSLPPAPKGPKAGKETKDRPVYPNWTNILKR